MRRTEGREGEERMNLKPFHLFEHQDKRCVINIEEMAAQAVDEDTAGVLGGLNGDPGSALLSDRAELLRKLDLISDDGRRAKEGTRKEPVPITNMALFLTQSCNLNCIYCYGKGGEYGTGGRLEEKTAYQAVDWLIEQSGKVRKIHVGFFGGEPFLNFPMMKAVAEYAQERVREVGKTVGFDLTTNATLLDDEKIAFIKEQNVSVLVSLDVPREIHDAQRPFASGKGSFDVIVPKLKKLLEECPRTPAHAVLTGNTDPELVKNALREIGFSNVSVLPASESLFSEESGETRPDRELNGIVKLLEQEAEAWIEHAKNKDGQLLKQLASDSQLYRGLLSFLHNAKRRYPCGAGRGLVGVSCAGDVFLCHRFVGVDDYRLGNVFDGDLDRDRYQQSPVTFVQECSSCSARYYCGGGCKHDNLGSCGSVFKPSEDMCRLKRREAELAAYVVCMLSEEDRAFLVKNEIVPPKPCLLDF